VTALLLLDAAAGGVRERDFPRSSPRDAACLREPPLGSVDLGGRSQARAPVQSLLAMGWIFGLSEVAIGSIHWFCVRRFLPSLSIRLASFDSKLLREMLGDGINSLM